MPNISALYIDDCEIGSKGAKALAAVLEELPSLRTLSLCTCEITASGGYTLARYCGVWGCYYYCCYSFSLLFPLFGFRCGSAYILSGVLITLLIFLLYVLCLLMTFFHVRSLSLRAVAKLPRFVNLELNGNQFTEDAIDAIRTVLHNAGKVLGGTIIVLFMF
jgi:hypothetical protein